MPEIKKDVLYWLNAILERKYEADKVIICVEHAKSELVKLDADNTKLKADNAKLREEASKEYERGWRDRSENLKKA